MTEQPELDLMARAETRTRTDQLLDAFERFHAENPEIWRLFQRFALEAVYSGMKSYSARAIIHQIRWHVEVETRGGELKLNDHTTPYYSRLFHLAYPQYDGFFRNRRLTSEESEAAKDDDQAFNCGPPGPEESIAARLAEILKAQGTLDI